MRRAWAALALRWRLRHEHVDQLFRRLEEDYDAAAARRELRRRHWTDRMIDWVLR